MDFIIKGLNLAMQILFRTNDGFEAGIIGLIIKFLDKF